MLVGCGCNCTDLPPGGSSESGTSASQSFSTSTPPQHQVSCNVCAGGAAPLSWDVTFNYGSQVRPGTTAADWPCLPFYANRVKPYRCVSIGQCGATSTSGGICRWRSPERSLSRRIRGATVLGCADEPLDPHQPNYKLLWHRVYILMSQPGGMASVIDPNCMPYSWQAFFGAGIRGDIGVIIRYGGDYDATANRKYGEGFAMYETRQGDPLNCLGPMTLFPSQFQADTPWQQGGSGPSGFGVGGDPNLPATVTLKPGPA